MASEVHARFERAARDRGRIVVPVLRRAVGFWFGVVAGVMASFTVVVLMSDSGARLPSFGFSAGFPLLAFMVAAWTLPACVAHALAEIVFLRLAGARLVPPRVAAHFGFVGGGATPWSSAIGVDDRFGYWGFTALSVLVGNCSSRRPALREVAPH